MRKHHWLSLLCLATMLTACDGLPDWLGTSEDDTPLEGDRIAVLQGISDSLKPDESLKSTTLSLAPTSKEDWTQEGGNAANNIPNPAFEGAFDRVGEASVGDGAKGDNILIPAPVIAKGIVYAIDAEGAVSAHEAGNIDHKLWVSKAGVIEDHPDVMGGGLAVDNGVLYVSTGLGRVLAINTSDGGVRWEKDLNFPLRSAPRVLNGKIFVITRDNQTFALNTVNGEVVWNQRGINEGASYLSLVTPVADGDSVIIPYSSGELFALKAGSGEELWSDSLVVSKLTSASGVFIGIDGNPVIADGSVYAIGNGGLMTVTSALSGRRIWEQEISSRNTPWVAGDAVFVLNSQDMLICLTSASGRIKWVTPLQRYADEEDRKNPLTWNGPVLAGNMLYVVGAHGRMLAISPQDGTIKQTIDVPDEIYTAPVVAGGVMYLVDKTAHLYAYR